MANGSNHATTSMVSVFCFPETTHKRRFQQIRNPQRFRGPFFPMFSSFLYFLFVFWKRWFWGSPSQHIPMRCQWLHLSNRLMVRRFGQFLWSDLRQVETQMWWMPGGCLTRHTRKTHRIGSGWGYCSGNFPSSFVSSKLYQTGDAWAIPSWWFTHVWRKAPPEPWCPEFAQVSLYSVSWSRLWRSSTHRDWNRPDLWRVLFRETCERSCCFFTEMK